WLGHSRRTCLGGGGTPPDRPARRRRDRYVVEPPHELPAPAVQPKQCGRVTTFRACQRSKSNVSIVIGAPEGAASRSSIWLKSQSKRRPSHDTEIVLRHISPATASALKPSISRAMYESRLFDSLSHSRKREIGMLFSA